MCHALLRRNFFLSPRFKHNIDLVRADNIATFLVQEEYTALNSSLLRIRSWFVIVNSFCFHFLGRIDLLR